MKKILVGFISIVLLLSINIVFTESDYAFGSSDDNELYKLLPGTWEESYQYSRIKVNVRTTFRSNGNYTEIVEITADENCALFNKGQSELYQVIGKWWIENGYLHRNVVFSSNPKIARKGQNYSSQIVSADKDTISFKHDYDVISTSHKGVRNTQGREVTKFSHPLRGWDDRDTGEEVDEDKEESEDEEKEEEEEVEKTKDDIISRTFGDKGTSGSFLIDALNDMGVNIEEKPIFQIIKKKLLENMKTDN